MKFPAFLKLTAFILVTSLFLGGCQKPEPAKPLTPEQRAKRRQIRAQAPLVYDNLLNASNPLCKHGECDYALKILEDDDNVNAYADGKKVFITKGMLDFLDNKEQLAIILSHELAHNLMEHISAKQKNALFGAIFDIAAAAGGVDTQGTFTELGGSAYSQKFELEADYVGLYIMARAGYPINNAAAFWRKMAVKFPKNIHGNVMSTHPGSAERFVALEKTAEEINQKKRTKGALLPQIHSKRKKK